ncbi:MAG TPA: D-hexose-6-phosphate mutarotase [Candidatus Sulfotelmatobacter sp.]|jgi:glucose-6-phosphate 1-epimerase|nr:D-hexose-6-phosphate mutarotase [Candidatus Sulfotelmatobacter sp.]
MATPAPLSDLNHRFEIPGIARIVDGRGGLPCVQVTSPRASGEIYLQGAHVTSWKPAGAEEVLYVSSKSKWQDGTAIRGGVPICFPWFADRTDDPRSPAHGLVRTKPWQLEGITHADHDVTVALSTSADDATRKTWFGDYHLLFCATFGEQLRIEIIVTNHGDFSFRFEEALHSYFRVANVAGAKLRGLNGAAFIDKTDSRREKHQHGDVVISAETDRVYLQTFSTVEIEDPGARRRVLVAKEDSRDTVVWNPWSEKAKKMSDIGADEWRQFVCVETCNVGDHAVTLAPAQAHTMTALISVSTT